MIAGAWLATVNYEAILCSAVAVHVPSTCLRNLLQQNARYLQLSAQIMLAYGI